MSITAYFKQPVSINELEKTWKVVDKDGNLWLSNGKASVLIYSENGTAYELTAYMGNASLLDEVNETYPLEPED